MWYQILCEAGHSIYRDYTDTSVDTHEKLCNFICPICGKRIAWFNLVTDTEDGAGDYVPLEQVDKSEVGVCPTCKQNLIIKQPTYRIPDGRGVKV